MKVRLYEARNGNALKEVLTISLIILFGQFTHLESSATNYCRHGETSVIIIFGTDGLKSKPTRNAT